MEALIVDALPYLSGVLGMAPQAHRSDSKAALHGDLSVARVDTIAGLEALAEEWQALENAPGSGTTPFQTYRFHREWLRHFVGPDTAFRIVTVREAGRLVLILPLAIRRTPVGNVAGWMGDPLLQYGDVITVPGADPTSWLDAALADLKTDGSVSVLTLRHVRADAAAAPWLKARMSPAGPAEQAIGVDLSEFSEPGDFARARVSRAARNRKRRRKLSQLGEVTFRVLESGEEAAALVGTAIEMKDAWLKSRGLIGRAFADDRMQACLEALVCEPGPSGVVVSCLEIDGRPASIEISFRHNGHHCAFIGAFCPDLSKVSPGQVQMQDTIEWCIGAGTHVYDLMAPADTYKRELGSIAVEVQDYTRLMSATGIPAAFWTTYGPRSIKAAFGLLPRGVRSTIRTHFT